MHPFPSATENTSQETVTVQVMKCVQREFFSNRKNIPLNSSSKTKTESDERCTEIIYSGTTYYSSHRCSLQAFGVI